MKEAGPLEEARRKGSRIKSSKHPVSKSRERGLPYPNNNSTTPAKDPVIQFNSILTLSGNIIRFHRPRAQSCKTDIPTPTAATNGKSKLSPGLQMKGSSDRLLQFNYCTRAAHKIQRNILFTRLPIYYKMRSLGSSQLEELHRYGEGVEPPRLLLLQHSPSPPCVHQSSSSLSSVLLGVYGGIGTQSWWTKSSALVD